MDSIAGEAQFELPPIEAGAGIRFSILEIAPNPAAHVTLIKSVRGQIRAELNISDEVVASTEDVTDRCS